MLDLASIFKDHTRYQIHRKAGAGGMGTVFEAYDRKLDRKVALKILHHTTEKEKKRALREARAQARVSHPNICKLYEIGVQNEHPYIAMQFIQGGDLNDRVNDLSMEQKIRIVIKVAHALHESHRNGLIHRDVKPSNVLIEEKEDGELVPYITDFGLAHVMDQPGMTQEIIAAGTPFYMSPEQVQGDHTGIDRRSDIYGLGIALYEVLTGKLPYSGKSGVAVLFHIMNNEPEPIRKNMATIPVDLESIVMKCIKKDPGKRYESTKALAEDLQRYLNGDPVSAHKDSLWYRMKRKILKNKIQSMIYGCSFIVLSVFFGLWVHSRWMANEQARFAQYFGQQAAELDAKMRFISMLPRQNIVAEKKDLNQAIQTMEKQCRKMNPSGQGPGYFAVGSSYLSLQEYEKARLNLEKAWDLGYHNPEVAYCLGQSFKALFEIASDEAKKIEDETIRNEKLKYAKNTFMKPAIHFLEIPGTAHALYRVALLSELQENSDKALDMARKASENAPWNYEAFLLQGHIYRVRAMSEWAEGANKKAESAFRLAEESLLKAQETAECDIRSYVALLNLWKMQISSEVYTKGNDIQLIMEKAQQTADQAFEIIPNHLNITVMLAGIDLWFAEARMKKGVDVRESIATIRKIIEMATKDTPPSEALLDALASTYLLEGELLMSRGEPAIPAYSEGLKQFQKAVKLNPQNANILNKMGLTYWNMGIYQLYHGESPLDNIDKAFLAFQKTTDITQGNYSALNNLGNVFGLKAYYEGMTGINPEQSLKQSLAYYKKSIEVNPSFSYGFNNLGTACMNLGSYELGKDRSPISYFDLAIEAFQKALELNPEYLSPHRNLAHTYAQKVEYESDHGIDPQKDIEQGELFTLKALEINANDVASHGIFIHLQELKIRILNPTGVSTTQYLKKGLESYRAAAKINPKNFNTTKAMVELYLAQVESRVETPESKKSYMDEAQSLLQKMLKINPGNYNVYLDLAQLEEQRGLMKLASGHSPETAWKKAIRWSSKALEINPDSATSREVFVRIQYEHVKYLKLDPAEKLKHIDKALEALELLKSSGNLIDQPVYEELLSIKKDLEQ